MSADRWSSIARTRQAYAMALSAALLVGIAAEPARADVIESIFEGFAGLGNPTATAEVFNSKPRVVFAIFYGNSTNCGVLVKLTEKPDGSWSETTVHTFAGGKDDGCGPKRVLLFSGGLVGVTTQLGGANNGGTEQVFDTTTGNQRGILSLPAGALEGASLPPMGKAPSSLGTARAKTTTLYITGAGGTYGTGAVYTSTLKGDGTLTAPQLIFSFPGGFGNVKGGQNPFAPAVVGADGNLYGTTAYAGTAGYGVVFKLTPPKTGQTWNETVLHNFTGAADGGFPHATVALDSAGNLYGTTTQGGMQGGVLTPCDANGFVGGPTVGCGVAFELTNKGSKAPWPEKVLWTFSGGTDGAIPKAEVVLDAKNNLYGTTFAGGNAALPACQSAQMENATPGCGVVFKLRGKKESVLYAFTDSTDGAEPNGPVELEGADIFGTTVAGGDTTDQACGHGSGLGYAIGCGVVFEIKP